MFKKLDEIVKSIEGRAAVDMAVACAADDSVLEAVNNAYKLGLINPILIGDESEIKAIIKREGFELGSAKILDIADKTEACMKAAALVGTGEVSLIMKGFVDSSVILKAVLNKENNLRVSEVLSHVLVMEISGFDRLFYITDSALNVAPDLNAKVGIVKNAALVAHALGNDDPKVACLCAVEKVNPKMQCTLDAAELVRLNKSGEITGCTIGGPFAMDNAVSEEAAKHKGVEDPVAGKADVLLAPDIEAGNILNKTLEYFAHAKKAGVIMGAKVPVVLTSRASSPEAKMYSIALGIQVARYMKSAGNGE